MTVTVWKYPKRDEWKSIMARPQMDLISLSRTVSDILESVRCEGDDALRRYEKQFDRVVLDALQVTPAEMEEGVAAVPESLKKAIRQAIDNIRKFHASQAIEVKKVETSPGVWCWQKPVGIEKVGLYVPGGTAPLFSTVLMLAVPARLAGCHEIVMCTPPGKEQSHPAQRCTRADQSRNPSKPRPASRDPAPDRSRHPAGPARCRGAGRQHQNNSAAGPG